MEALFKVGDIVRVKSWDWYEQNKNEYGCVINKLNNGQSFTPQMTYLLGTEQEIGKVIKSKDKNGKDEIFYQLIGERFCWYDFMFENTVLSDEKIENILDDFIRGEKSRTQTIEAIKNLSNNQNDEDGKNLFKIDSLKNTAEANVVDAIMEDVINDLDINTVYHIMSYLEWEHQGEPVSKDSIKACIKSTIQSCISSLKANYKPDKYFKTLSSTGGFQCEMSSDENEEYLDIEVKFIALEAYTSLSKKSCEFKSLEINSK